MLSLLFLGLFTLSLISILSKLFFLAPTGPGCVVMLSNVLYETLFKKFGWKRHHIDFATLPLLGLSWMILCGPWSALLYAIVFGLVWSYALLEDLHLRNCDPGEQDKRYEGRVPLPHPRLIAILRGAVWNRKKVYDLGDWPLGYSEQFDILILNPTILPPQYFLKIEISPIDSKLTIHRAFPGQLKAPPPGEYLSVTYRITAAALSETPVEVTFKVTLGTYQVVEKIRIRSIFLVSDHPLEKSKINRWKGGTRAGFGWRGDMDLYDPATFQSVEGLRSVLDLSKRYRVPSTLFLSGRLSLDKDEHRKFCERLGVDRDTDGIDRFIEFIQRKVFLAHTLDFPYEAENRYAMELGNHMYLHYGTHAAMCEGNGWRSHVRMGAGCYSWQSTEEGSFAEQRDNAVKNVEIVEKTFGFRVKTWGVPGREYDEFTPKAVEAAGMEVGSDTNASAFTNALKLPPPHHPMGTERLVELTKKYPGDPDNAFKIAMLKYWIWLAWHRGQTFIYMTHHHALRYQGISCLNLTDAIFRHVLQDYRGDFYISTLYGLGNYWDYVLCPKHRRISSEVVNSSTILVKNHGNQKLDSIPIEVSFKKGKRKLLLVDLLPSEEKEIFFS